SLQWTSVDCSFSSVSCYSSRREQSMKRRGPCSPMVRLRTPREPAESRSDAPSAPGTATCRSSAWLAPTIAASRSTRPLFGR
ncbi:hypothetical protein PFISCL1PPCAC_28700, partial [Pristionchus fissidentatus]